MISAVKWDYYYIFFSDFIVNTCLKKMNIYISIKYACKLGMLQEHKLLSFSNKNCLLMHAYLNTHPRVNIFLCAQECKNVILTQQKLRMVLNSSFFQKGGRK